MCLVKIVKKIKHILSLEMRLETLEMRHGRLALQVKELETELRIIKDAVLESLKEGKPGLEELARRVKAVDEILERHSSGQPEIQ